MREGKDGKLPMKNAVTLRAAWLGEILLPISGVIAWDIAWREDRQTVAAWRPYQA
jgi:hypothetical protein